MPNKPQRSDITCDGRRYDDHPEFTPDLSPETMARLGVFGGAYFADDLDDNKGIPEDVLKHSTGDKDKSNNAFGVHSGMSREKWAERGWLTDDNPRGWYEWYVRFDAGERFDEDEDQIGRWKDFRNRWSPNDRQALKNMSPGDGTRQALLHWALHPWTPEMSVEDTEG